MIQGLVESYHYDAEVEVCFNTNRGWTALLDAMSITHPDSKMICCVRDINWILDSFETLFRKNPFSLSKMYSSDEATTVYTRSEALMTPGHTLRFAYDCLKEAMTGPNANKLFILDYEQLAKHPEQMMRALYNFIGEPYFQHDFETVEATYDEFDQDANINGLHTIRRGVKFIKRTPIIPQDIWQKFSNLEGWK